MSKHLVTKRRILGLLGERPMTRAELSKALGLTPATLSQHLQSLEDSGAIYVDPSSGSRKWKYYKLNRGFNMNRMNRERGYSTAMTLGSVAVIVIAAVVVLSLVVGHSRQQSAASVITIPHTTTKTLNTSASGNISITPGEFASACPVILTNQTFNSSIVGYSGLKYYDDNGTPEYIIAPGTNGSMVLALGKPARSSNLEISNFAAFYYSTGQNNSYANRYAMNSTNGVSVSFNVSSEYLTSASPNATVRIGISAASNANEGTYRVFIPEGPCRPDAASFLLTVGNKPYNGTVNEGIFA